MRLFYEVSPYDTSLTGGGGCYYVGIRLGRDYRGQRPGILDVGLGERRLAYTLGHPGLTQVSESSCCDYQAPVFGLELGQFGQGRIDQEKHRPIGALSN
jgi:hypothetical protein